MPDTHSRSSRNALYAEHLKLGATFVDGVVARYAQEVVPATTDDAMVFLCDMSSSDSLVFSGPDAPAFASAAFAGRKLAQGESTFEPALTGDGGIASIPLLCRTGAHEYVTLDLSARSAVLGAWLSFLANVSQDGYAPYARMQLTEASGTHVVLVLAGARAQDVLSDYVFQGALPHEGEVASCMLDGHIPCIVAQPSCAPIPCFVLFVAPSDAITMWRSLLSFNEVAPVGRATLTALLEERAFWFARLRTTDALRLSAQELQASELVRADPDFVGARALHDANER